MGPKQTLLNPGLGAGVASLTTLSWNQESEAQPTAPYGPSFHKSLGTDGGVSPGGELFLRQGKASHTPQSKDDPCLRSPFVLSSHAGLQTSTKRRNLDFFSFREITATGTPRAPLTPRSTPHTHRPVAHPPPRICSSRVRCTCSHGRHWTLSPQSRSERQR